MRLPAFAKNGRLTAVIPELSGGVDHSKAPWLIADNALADSDNVCWKDGALRTRAGFYTEMARLTTGEGNTRRFFTDREGWVISCEIVNRSYGTDLIMRAVDRNGYNGGAVFRQVLPLGSHMCCVPAGSEQGNYTTLLFLSNGQVVTATPSEYISQVHEDGAYVPLICIDGRPTSNRNEATDYGTRYEQMNRLTNTFRCHFTSDGQGVYYWLPHKELTGVVTVETVDAEDRKSVV